MRISDWSSDVCSSDLTHDNGSPVEPGGFYAEDNFPPTSVRMQLYADAAPTLALEAIRTLSQQANISGITHLIVASCTGFIAPGVDQIIAARLGLSPSVARLLVGYLGCYAADRKRTRLNHRN